jgi:hypothetical protein
MGARDTSRRDRLTSVEVVALGLALLWLGGSATVFLTLDPAGRSGEGDALWFIVVLLAVFLPVGMIWVAAVAARTARIMREESRRLQIAIDAIRNAYLAESQTRNTASEPSVTRKLEEIAAAQRKIEAALSASGATPRATGPEPAAEGLAGQEQVALPLGTPAEETAPPPETADFIRALNFPDTAEDRDGFAALRRALRDRPTAQLIQAAQDVLTLMSHDGIYMDDLRPDLARPEIWRRFAGGERGRSVAMLGGIRDRTTLALTAARMKNDPIFRDAAHHFLRLFDRMISDFARQADDTALTELSNTRTARAFMILGRVTGTFD